jgi:hypothetical protein
MSGPDAGELLSRWPQGRPIGLLALSPGSPGGWVERVANDPAVRRWWDCRSENMFAGPTVEAPFQRALMLELTDAAQATSLVPELSDLDPSGQTTVLAASPLPGLARTVMRAMSGVLRHLPQPRVPEGAPAFAATPDASEVNPSAAQVEAFLKHPGDPPLMVVNLNLHLERGIDPDTGEEDSGRAIADKYFRRGIRTFSRLGARPAFAGACRGALIDGLRVGAFDQIGLIHYASRDDFAKLMQVASAEGWARYREAGLARSWVVHCRVEATSES